jgi:hypothetical protein
MHLGWRDSKTKQSATPASSLIVLFILPFITRGRGVTAGVELVTFVVSITVLRVGRHRHLPENRCFKF